MTHMIAPRVGRGPLSAPLAWLACPGLGTLGSAPGVFPHSTSCLGHVTQALSQALVPRGVAQGLALPGWDFPYVFPSSLFWEVGHRAGGTQWCTQGRVSQGCQEARVVGRDGRTLGTAPEGSWSWRRPGLGIQG